MNVFEQKLYEQISKENFFKIQKTKIGIAGLGGLGSNCAMNLVRSGFKQFKLIDFDKVEYTNLNRQFYFEDQVKMLKTKALSINLKRINPDLEIETFALKIEQSTSEDLFRDCDVIIEALDRADYKSMLVSKILPLGKLTVCASGIAGIGNSDLINIHWLKRNLVIVGDLSSDIKNKPPLSPKLNIAAAKQADVVLEYTINSL